MVKENTRKVLVIGCGELGSRHIQGLLRSSLSLQIFAYDTSEGSLKSCKERCSENQRLSASSSVVYSSDYSLVRGSWSLVIIATTSQHRKSVIQSLIESIKFDALIIEKLLSNSVCDLRSIYTMLSTKSNVWVNCPRRAMLWHQSLKSRINSRGGFLDCKVSLGHWELATNAIHFIDLISWMNHDNPLKLIHATDLGLWRTTKRSGYFDTYGTLNCEYTNGKKLIISCDKDPMNTKLVFSTPQGDWNVDEIDGIDIDPMGNVYKGSLQFQSEMTGLIADQIFIKGTCPLPTLQEVFVTHVLLLDVFDKHWNNRPPLEGATLLIT